MVCHIDTSAKGSPKETSAAKPVEIVEDKKEVSQPVVDTKSDVLSPAARKIAEEKNIDINQITGTGKAGRITKQDVLLGKPAMGNFNNSNRSESRNKLSMLRRKVAERLVTVKNETAMLTTFNEVDMSSIFELRKKYKEKFKEKHGVNLGFMSFFTLASVRALKEFPAVNSMIDGSEMISYSYCDISIAVSGPKGLMVPVIRSAEELKFKGVELEVKRLAERARDGQITVDEMTGGTFTISNGGVFGSMLSTPIINPPQSAILGMHNIVERPIAVNGKVEIRPVEVMHYKLPIYGFRIKDFTYITDMKTISDEEKKKLAGTKILILNALQKSPHISHLTLEEAIVFAQEIGADHTYFTHLSHKMGRHKDVTPLLPDNISIAFDGLQINC